MRIGHGYDVHKLVKGRKLILGGVMIVNDMGLLGHSDADVLTHAIMDSLLGSLALGDIGKLFPDTDERYKDANSIELLRQVARLIDQRGFRIVNIDATICAQKPKLAGHINHMRLNIARACAIDVSQVSIKATTEEGLGFTGNLEGISATAVCLVNERSGGFFGVFTGNMPFMR